jgi:hypothetical protein
MLFTNSYEPSEALSNLALDTAANTNDYHADEVAPILKVDTPKREIWRVDPGEEQRRDTDDRRAFGTKAKRVDFSAEKLLQYNIEDHALEHALTVEKEAGMDPALRASFANNYTEILTKKIALRKEANLLSLISTNFTTSTYTDTPTTKFDESGAEPLKFLIGIIEDKIALNSGVQPNVAWMDFKTVRAITRTAEFNSEVSGFSSSDMDKLPYEKRAEILAGVLGLDEIIITRNGFKNTAAKGATKSLVRYLADNIFLFRREPVVENQFHYSGTIISPTWENPILTRDSGGGMAGGWRVETKYDDDTRSNVVRVGNYYDQLIVNKDTGFWVTNTLTT